MTVRNRVAAFAVGALVAVASGLVVCGFATTYGWGLWAFLMIPVLPAWLIIIMLLFWGLQTICDRAGDALSKHTDQSIGGRDA